MPSGRTHDSITLWCLVPLSVLGFALTQNGTIVFFLCACFLFSGLMFGPDLDIHSQQYKRWGPLRSIWLPYRQSMSHRSTLSHGPIIGTALRVGYLFTLVASLAITIRLGWAIGQQLRHPDLQWHSLVFPWIDQWVRAIAHSLKTHPGLWIAAFLGLEMGAMSHSISDILGSWIKRQQRKRARR
jgi:uncharacterized metal-binding protein